MGNVVNILLLLLMPLHFLGCGTGTSTSSSSGQEVTLSGYVIDGRISGANVCLDANINGLCDSGEEITATNQNGYFNFGTFSSSDFPIVSYMVQNGIDTATGKNFIGTLRYVQPLDTESTTYVTPLTDMAARYFFNQKSRNIADIYNSKFVVAKAYNLPNHILKNPLEFGGVFIRSQEIQQVKSMFETLVIKTKGKVPSFAQRVILRENIKTAMLTSIADNNYSFNTIDALAKLEKSIDLVFANNEKVFVSEQLANIKSDLEYYNQYDLNISDPRFDKYQNMLEDKAEIAYDIINNADENSTMNPFDLDIDVYAEDNNDTDDNNTDTDTNTTDNYVDFNGTVVDGYIKDATVCIDLEYDGACNIKDPYAQTDTDGVFSFTDLNISKDMVYPIISSGGVDTFTGNNYVGKLKGLIVTNEINGSISTIISPLTDILAYDFISQETKDETTYESSIRKIASALEVSEVELLSDVAQNKALFTKSLFLEQIKYAIEKTILNNGYKDTSKIRSEVNTAIYERVLAKGYTDLLVEQVISNVVVNLPISSINADDRNFFIETFDELKVLLESASNSTDVLTYTLPTLQIVVEDKIQVLFNDFTPADLNLSVEDIVYSEFDTNGAAYDEMACKLDGVYSNHITDNNETLDVPAIDSSFGMQLDASESGDVSVYYANNTNTLQDDFTTIWDDEKRFNFLAFDKSWVDGTNKSVYIKTPQNNEGKNGCYKVVLDSIRPGDIELEKVFRYAN